MALTRVYKNLDHAQSSNKTWKTGDRIMHSQKAESSVDMQNIRQFRDQRAAQKVSKGTSVKKRDRWGNPVEIMKDGKLFSKRTDGKWYSE